MKDANDGTARELAAILPILRRVRAGDDWDDADAAHGDICERESVVRAAALTLAALAPFGPLGSYAINPDGDYGVLVERARALFGVAAGDDAGALAVGRVLCAAARAITDGALHGDD